jgi:hypothetical protein
MGQKKFPMGPMGFPMGGKGQSLPTWEFPWEGRGKEVLPMGGKCQCLVLDAEPKTYIGLGRVLILEPIRGFWRSLTLGWVQVITYNPNPQQVQVRVEDYNPYAGFGAVY